MSEPIRTPNENPSRVEDILSDTIGLPGYEIEPPRSRIETLLITLDGSIAANVVASVDPSTYVLTLTLKNKNNQIIGTPATVDLPLEATVVGGRYDSQTQKLILTLQSGSTIEIPLSDLIYGLQNEITTENPLDADLVDDTNSDHKFVSTVEKTAWNGKQDAIDNSHKLDADLVDDSNSTNKFNVQANWTESTSSSPAFIQNKPILGTASALDVAVSGDASSAEVVKGNDSRLTNARNAADVYSWAKQSSKPLYDYSEITNTPTIPSAGSSDPLMDGTASAGTASTYSKSDHVHPTDTSRQAVINSNNKLGADLVDDTNATHKFATAAQLQQIETNKTNISSKQDALVVGTNLDNTPTENSTNPITSGGVYSTVGNIDSALSGLIMSLEPKTITANGTYNPTDDGIDGYNMVTVNVGGSVAEKAVNFYDYDGTVVASYTAAEFAELTAMPANPAHIGLTSQGWNWTLADAKTYVASYGKLNIGQMYITSDGKTRLYIRLNEGRLQPWLKLYLNANSELDIDWGDGSAHSTFTSTSAAYSSEMHTYTNAGSYVIAITVVSGGFIIQSSSSSISTLLTNNNNSTSSPDIGYLNSIKKVEMGSGITSIGQHAFNTCYSLASITIPSSVTSIGSSAFRLCYSLTSITIPSSVTSFGNSVLEGCYSLASITIPSSVTSIGSSALESCRSLASITIPSSVTSISGMFFNCQSLSSITIPSSVTNIDRTTFGNCYSLTSIIIPSSVTSINYAFDGCYSLATITINKSEGSISGSPWGASTSSPTSTQIVWTG